MATEDGYKTPEEQLEQIYKTIHEIYNNLKNLDGRMEYLEAQNQKATGDDGHPGAAGPKGEQGDPGADGRSCQCAKGND